MREIEVVAPNIKRNQTGVTSTIIAAVGAQARLRKVAALGLGLPASLPQLRWADLLRGWSRPPGLSHRIWHARRPDEMAVGLVLRDVLRQPWKLVFTSHDAHDHPKLYRWMAARMDALVASTPASARAIDPRAHVIGHGVDPEAFQPAPDRAAEWRALGLPGAYGLGTFGRLRPQKGQDVLVRALCETLPRHPQAGYVIAGLTTSANQGFEEGLRAQLAAAGIADRVTFLGEVDAAMIRRLYAAVSLYIQPGRSEGYGLTPIEAMASGTAAISTRVGAATDMVIEGVTGHLVDVEDWQAMAARLEERLSDMAGTLAMGVAGRAHVLAHHTAEIEALRLFAVYDRLVPRDGLQPAPNTPE
jgi:mannosyltransferase